MKGRKMIGAGSGGGLKTTSKIAKYIQHLKTGIKANAMLKSPLEIQTVKKKMSHYFLVCPIRSDPAAFLQPLLQSAPAFSYPFGSLVPWSTQVCQAMTADRYKPICPRAAWHMNSEGLCELEEKSPKRRKKLSLFRLEKPLTAFLQRAAGVCQVRCSRWCCSPYSSSGQGMPRCSKLASSQVHEEAFQATQLLTALQLFFHAVLLYITVLSLPGGTAVLQYNRLAKCKTDFFHLPNTT